MELEKNRLITESHRLSYERHTHHAVGHRLSERMHQLNEEAVLLTKEMRKLNEKEAEATHASLAEAMKTSSSTRVNIEVCQPGCFETYNFNVFQLLLLTTPFGIVLQYFSSEQQVIFFKRSPTTLVLATLVLMLLLRVLIVAIPYCGTSLRRIFSNTFFRKEESQSLNRDHGDSVELRETRNV